MFETDDRGEIDLRFASEYKISGDDLYTDARGRTMIPIGTITIEETREPSGYRINREKKVVHFTQQPDGTVRSDSGDWNTANQAEDLNIISEETSVKGSASVTKTDAAGTAPQGDASIVGIRFAVINRSTNPVVYKGTEYAAGSVIEILSTNASGACRTAEKSVPYGSYEIAELRADAAITAGETYNNSSKLGSSAYANNTG